ncbi:MAG TPA: class I lanthipeptide [Thermoanaerobaculia bacterium]|nr:class I lanthipeptide [Thermoanaerobaculia bacterium]
MKKESKKLVLSKETLLSLEAGQLHNAAGNGTYTYSFPCCPLTRPRTRCC